MIISTWDFIFPVWFIRINEYCISDLYLAFFFLFLKTGLFMYAYNYSDG